jgi:hypothetical protein
MARRDPSDNAPLDHLIGDLALSPVSDGAPRLFGGLAGHGHDGADLLGRDPRPLARARGIAEAFLETEFGQGDRLKEEPAFPPESNHVEADLMRVREVPVAPPLGSFQDDLGPQDQLLRGGVSPDQGVEGVSLLVSQFDGQGFGATHIRLRMGGKGAASR